MCDNLGIDDTKVEVYAYTYQGHTIIDENIQHILDFIRHEMENLYDGEKIELEITAQIMTRSQIDALPEFEGY